MNQVASRVMPSIDAHAQSTRDDSAIRADYQNHKAWGLLASIDLRSCNAETIRDADAIKRYVAELCERIDMKRYGDTLVVHFGDSDEVAGFSMSQLIETSQISAHFANATNTTYLDIFSCKYFNVYEASEFTKEFFGGSHYDLHYTLRI
jgi:S-adenosylmethionine/arginine decarboxylase-like enzyme